MDSKFEQALSALVRGDNLYRVGNKLYRREFRVDKIQGEIRYKSMRKKKDDPRTVFKIDLISELREGIATDTLKRKTRLIEALVKPPDVADSHCFSVIFSDGRILDLVADSEAARDRWILGIRGFQQMLASESLGRKKERLLRTLFNDADKNKNGTLDFTEIALLLEKRNVSVNNRDIGAMVRDFGISTRQKHADILALDYEGFKKMYDFMTEREEVKTIFTKYNIKGDFISARELQSFLAEELKEKTTVEQCQQLIQNYEPVDAIKKKGEMGVDGMYSLLESDIMDIFDATCKVVYQDMAQPLSHYFIDSSHNTYLSGYQVFGKSSVENYIQALVSGCRCVEIDCWDGSDGEPVVTHGRAFTSEIKFEDAIKTINEYSFKTSSFPVILSLENHCSVKQQVRLAEILSFHLQDNLYTGPVPPDAEFLPSPESLKGKIILKAPALRDLDDIEGENDDNTNNSEEDEPEEVEDAKNTGHTAEPSNTLGQGKEFPAKPLNHFQNDEENARDGNEHLNKEPKITNEVENEQTGEPLQVTPKRKKSTRLATTGQLADYIVLCRSTPFQDFVKKPDGDLYTKISSIKERKAESFYPKSVDCIIHTRIQLTRIYPNGRRFLSSNFNPLPFWAYGHQIVAMNYQKSDDNMHRYKGFFLDNGNSGYVLKPEYMRKGDPVHPQTGPFPKVENKKLSLEIISGYRLPKEESDILDPYVEVHVEGFGVEKQLRKTKKISNNGFHPQWDSEAFEFDVRVPEMTLVRFYVKDDAPGKDPLVAQYCLPFKCMKQGYRVVHLKDPRGKTIKNAQLFVHVNIE